MQPDAVFPKPVRCCTFVLSYDDFTRLAMATFRPRTTDVQVCRSIHRSRLRGVCLRSRAGQAAVEFALVMPMMMVLIFGAIEFGTAMYDKAVITNASREGARFGIVATTPRKTNRQIQDVVSNYSKRYVINYKKTAADTAVTTVTCQAPAPSACTPAQRTSGVLMIVTTDYTYPSFLLPKFLTGLNGFGLRATTVMRME
jgi:Flp pilus assembly protein TadG